MKKRVILMLVALSVLIGMKPLERVLAEELKKEDVIEEYYAFAVEGIEKFYHYKDEGITNNWKDYVSADMYDLLEAKIEMETFQRDTYGLEYKEYQITIKAFDEKNWVENDNKVDMSLQIIRTWYYCSEPTTISEVINVSVIKGTENVFLIESCYDKYESITYGPIDEVYQEAKVSRSNISTKEALSSYVSQYKEQCINKAEMMRSVRSETSGNVEPRADIFLQRANIINWARSNYNQTTPTSASASVSYYDFSQISSAYDCTNFVSHALLAGNATMHDDGDSGITGTDQWYFRSTSNRSSSWAGVNQLYAFLVRSNPSDTNIGPYAEERELVYTNVYEGDIVQGHNGTTWRHSTIVTKVENQQVYVTGRTSPEAYNDNQLATTIYGTQRVLHIMGNYTGQ